MVCVWCSDNSLYIGITNNLDSRVKEHNKGIGAQYTKERLPVNLLCYEAVGDKFLARKREAQLKKWSKAKKELWVHGFPSIGSG
ncbi:MAG: GIY-YIG nuclease family protein [bacterium]